MPNNRQNYLNKIHYSYMMEYYPIIKIDFSKNIQFYGKMWYVASLKCEFQNIVTVCLLFCVSIIYIFGYTNT